MSLYNALFGVNPFSADLLALIDFGSIAGHVRFRDVHIVEENGDTLIAVYTRNGGGNRQHYGEEGVEAGAACGCTGCTITHAMPLHPLYVRDEDDSFDSTYATVFFKVPEAGKQLLSFLQSIGADKTPEPGKRFQEFLDKLRDPSKRDDPEVKRALGVGESILSKLPKDVTGGG